MFALSTWLVLGASETSTIADQIRLRTGETVQGKLIPDTGVKDRILLFRTTGKSPMVMSPGQVVGVTALASILDDYAQRRLTPISTAQAEFDMGEWCDDHALKDLAQAHYEAAVKRDESFAPAHVKLGHVEVKGKWLDREQLKAAGGLIHYKGKWITPEEHARKSIDDAASAEQSHWQKRITLMLRSYRAGPENRTRDVERQLLAIRDPVAIGPIQKTLGTAAEPELRILGARILQEIPVSQAVSALVDRLLAEPTQEVREAILEALHKRGDPLTVPRLANALKSKTPEVLNRAAWALGEMRAVESVPKLIASLVTIEYRMVWVNPGMTTGVTGDPTAPSFGTLPLGRSYPVMTGPVVGPGVVAFGATSTNYPQAFSNAGVNIGGLSRGPVQKMESFARRNTEVLNSLKRLTDQDFDYDVAAWKRWSTHSFQAEPTPARVVPQP